MGYISCSGAWGPLLGWPGVKIPSNNDNDTRLTPPPRPCQPPTVRAMGMRVALSAKAREGRVVVVEHLRLPVRGFVDVCTVINFYADTFVVCVLVGWGRSVVDLTHRLAHTHTQKNTNTQEAKTRVLDKALRHHEWARNEDNEENVHPRRMLFLDGAAALWRLVVLKLLGGWGGRVRVWAVVVGGRSTNNRDVNSPICTYIPPHPTHPLKQQHNRRGPAHDHGAGLPQPPLRQGAPASGASSY